MMFFKLSIERWLAVKCKKLSIPTFDFWVSMPKLVETSPQSVTSCCIWSKDLCLRAIQDCTQLTGMRVLMGCLQKLQGHATGEHGWMLFTGNAVSCISNITKRWSNPTRLTKTVGEKKLMPSFMYSVCTCRWFGRGKNNGLRTIAVTNLVVLLHFVWQAYSCAKWARLDIHIAALHGYWTTLSKGEPWWSFLWCLSMSNSCEGFHREPWCPESAMLTMYGHFFWPWQFWTNLSWEAEVMHSDWCVVGISLKIHPKFDINSIP